MTARSYRESAGLRRRLGCTADPDNKLLLAASAATAWKPKSLRDALLAVSGMLDETMFGPGSLDEAQRRRSIYFTIKRSQLVPLMVLFDAPEPLQGVGATRDDHVAPQALALMNNATHPRLCAGLCPSDWPPKASGALDDSIRARLRLRAGREPAAQDDWPTAGSSFRQQVASYRSAGKSNAAELALADFCQVLMSLNEFVRDVD